MKRRKQLPANAVDEIAAIDQVLLTEREQVSAVAPLGRRRQAEQELRTEVGDQLSVGRRGGVVELVDDDVVERVWREPLQVLATAQRLDRSEHDVGVRLLRICPCSGQGAPRADAAEGVERLVEDLLAMRDEQHAPELRAVRVERREPRLSKSGRQHDEAGLVAGGSRRLRAPGERPSAPHSVRPAAWRLRLRVRGLDDRPLNRSSRRYRSIQSGQQFLRRRMTEERLERGHRFGVSAAVTRRHDAVVPLHRAREGGRAEI